MANEKTENAAAKVLSQQWWTLEHEIVRLGKDLRWKRDEVMKVQKLLDAARAAEQAVVNRRADLSTQQGEIADVYKSVTGETLRAQGG
jgi:hypothetical protein